MGIDPKCGAMAWRRRWATTRARTRDRSRGDAEGPSS
jgi:hypothetical protein